jgi:hypothetical protein
VADGWLAASNTSFGTMVPSVSVPVSSLHRMFMLPRFFHAVRADRSQLRSGALRRQAAGANAECRREHDYVLIPVANVSLCIVHWGPFASGAGHA